MECLFARLKTELFTVQYHLALNKVMAFNEIFNKNRLFHSCGVIKINNSSPHVLPTRPHSDSNGLLVS